MGLLQRIRWIKNIKRNEGADWAYMEDFESDSFDLAFAPEHAAGAAKPEQGDVIVLFQTVNDSDSWAGGTYLTHLVLVDSAEANDTRRANYPHGRGVIVLARTSPATSLKSRKIHMSFEDVNSGQLCDFNLFNKGNNPDDNRRRIIELFTPYF
jgi:hypothetical protein